MVPYELWTACQAFVGDVCRDRDASHGLAHMQLVTEQALLILQLNSSSSSSTSEQQLARVILVGMLHDVNDHKYDKDGSLGAKVLAFVSETVVKFPTLFGLVKDGEDGANGGGSRVETAEDADRVVSTVMKTISAISYSKEKKLGMRWFEKELPGSDWVAVRDAVSDADKLEAIGASGLIRSFEYNCCQLHESGKLQELLRSDEVKGDANVVRRMVAQNVVEHADEKLLHLKDLFIVTRAGKFLARPRHDEMVVELAAWAKRGPPELPHNLLS